MIDNDYVAIISAFLFSNHFLYLLKFLQKQS
ncbi:hypothetical protein LGAS_1095 [Lactobacillus gasseri ATCC 33323 = JCM 1131]|uniref:Uncharacterized protein n=1 Tax=Lactobacillus gasseri (strain ATCC 33323 / DSM 20243 / BCRC 14619 / CIP 102991 / JCM 1131 / KCTC 3163 / NCIMB 11718 / NCTC 13722 / AM63) TaxID=324831 RepID=A0A805ZQB6_LACGA|nr:hypothetical protein LGAS_1095 [Lactobacillus gasseri ATCC 33323 = JCM 1131]